MRDPETEERLLVPLLARTEREKSGPSAAAMVMSAVDVCIDPFTEKIIRVRSDRAGLSLVTPVQRRRSPVFVTNGLIYLPV
jgi:hypothetical protein